MDGTEVKLLEETNKWLSRLEARLKGTKAGKAKGVANSMENIQAYIEDCRHFMDQKDFINAFEAVIYAWGIFETLERLELLTTRRAASELPVVGDREQ